MSSMTVKAGKTYYVAGTFDGTRIRLYVNGVLQSTTKYAGRLNTAPYGGAVAWEGWGALPSPHYQGSVDEVAIYDHALTAKRIATHYETGRGQVGHRRSQ
jgi:hypothetical protein